MSDDSRQLGVSEQVAALRRDFAAKLVIRADQLSAALDRWLRGEADGAAKVEELVHQVAGSAGSFGFAVLSEAAGRLEERLRAGIAVASAEVEVLALIELMRSPAAGVG